MSDSMALGLPDELYTPCRRTLQRCREFWDYKILRSVFAPDLLFPFRFGLPRADNPEDQVDLLLDHLIGQRLSSGQPVLPIFLATLRDRYEAGDALRDDLEDLCTAIEKAMERKAPAAQPTPRRRHLLLDRLLQLDFRPQVRMVRQVVDERRVAAFLIHGPPGHGQRMLAYRLVHLRPEWETGQQIVIDAGSNGIGKSHRALRSQLGRRLQLSSTPTAEELAAKVGAWWQTQDVIFVFHTVDYIPPNLLSGWIEEFWGPLVDMALRSQYQTRRHTHLLLFLVDYAGEVCQSNLILARRPEDLAVAPMPLLLPAIEPFPEVELEIWIDGAAEVVPSGLPADHLVAAPYDGVPELVYDKICEHCGFSWEGEIAQ